MSTDMNAKRCVEYLRKVGVEITPETIRSWMETERLHRKRRRVVLKCRQYRCAGCARLWQKIGKAFRKTEKCPDCGSRPAEMWLLWYQRGDGTVHNTNAVAWSKQIKGDLGLDG